MSVWGPNAGSNAAQSTPLITSTTVAGETFAAYSVVYLDCFNARGNGATRWYKCDNSATSPVKLSPIVGVALTAGTAGNPFTFQGGGVVTGFSGLTAGQLCWVGMAGGVVQTQPALPSSGSQVAVAIIGLALSSTSIYLEGRQVETIFTRYQSQLAVGSTATVEHWTDTGSRSRGIAAYLVNSLEPALSAYYKLDEGTGSSTVDATGITGPGTLQNSPTWSSSVPSGLSFTDPYCLSFNGTNQYVNVPYNSALSLSVSFSIGAWVYPTSYGSNVCITSKSDGNYVNYSFYISSAGQIGYYYYNGTPTNPGALSGTGLTVPLNQWSYVAVTVTGTSCVLYCVNGGTLGSATATLLYAPTTNTGPMAIGAYLGNSGMTASAFFPGRLDSLGFWTRVLSSSDVQSLGNGNPPSMYDSPITPGNPVINSGSSNNINVTYGDASSLNPSTYTTFKNATSLARDVACQVIL